MKAMTDTISMQSGHSSHNEDLIEEMQQVNESNQEGLDTNQEYLETNIVDLGDSNYTS